jgi:hypothetical protein
MPTAPLMRRDAAEGVNTMPGPPPNPNSRRQSGNQAHTWLDLPAEGYAGSIPDWPIGEADVTERAMWDRYWRKPQAAAWARIGLTDEVALYVRAFVIATRGDIKAMAEARQIGDRLGLNPTAMLKNRWRVVADEVTDKREAKKPAQKRRLVVATDALARS